MQIIVPMAGLGKRFLKDGFNLPKSLIEIEGKPIIAHVINMFPNEDFIFICNENHLKNTNLSKELKKYSPNCKIISIPEHKKGPVYSVSKIFDLINNNEPLIINYCDFCCYWDYKKFKTKIINSNLDGFIPAYKGFHPHSLRCEDYAFIKQKNNLLIEIKEKESFTNNKINEYASSGTYFFKKGFYVKKYFNELIEKNISVNSEFYCSLVYNLMTKNNLKVGIYHLDHFMQWGTPRDLKEYKIWSDAFRELTKEKEDKIIFQGSTLITMGGKGKRFLENGYKTNKPMININKKPMFLKATKSLPSTDKYRFAFHDSLLKSTNIEELIKNEFPKSSTLVLDSFTNGQAITALKSIEDLPDNEKITISACDHGILYNEKSFEKIFLDNSIDIILWAVKWHPPSELSPKMYSWLKVDKNDYLIDISLKGKKFLNCEASILIGTFTFKSKKNLKFCIQNLVKRNGLINNEFYIDACLQDAILLGLKIKVFYVDHFLCWGTPNELKTFKYWQSCFNKWDGHPYKLENDCWY